MPLQQFSRLVEAALDEMLALANGDSSMKALKLAAIR